MNKALLLVPLLLVAGCLDAPPGDAQAPSPTASPSASPTPEPAPPSATPSPVAGEPEALPIRTLDQDPQSGIREETRLVITDQETWQATWEQHSMGGRPAPEVDLTQETILVATSGARPNGCWGIEIVDVTHYANGSTVATVSDRAPDPSRMCIQVITYPAHIVAVSGAGRNVTFA